MQNIKVLCLINVLFAENSATTIAYCFRMENQYALNAPKEEYHQL